MNTSLYYILRKKTVSFLTLLSIILSLFLTSPAYSATSQFSKLLSYQGKLTTSAGVTVADSTYNFRFRIYTTATGGSAIFDETISATTVGGIFSIQAGNASSTADLNFNQPLYVGMTINNDPEMTPRKELSSAPFAFEADKLDGLDSSDFVQTNSTSTIASTSANTIFTVNQQGTGGILSLQKTGVSMLEVTNDGNVGIGTSSPYAKLSVVGEVVASKFTATSTATSTFGGGISSAKGINIEDPSACFSVAGVCIAGGGGGITSLRAEYSGAQSNVAQIFSTTSDTNLNLIITSAGGTHTFTPSWSGSLSVSRGGTGLTTASLGDILVGNGTGYTAYSTSTLGLLTTNVAEGTNLYFTNDRFDTRLSSTTTLP
ncbi:TPA: hypothetical protein DDZ75_02905, partial [Patescibacteria group bacterium]|nr:hypothetical protein [Patescibacteria group bacterium]